MCEVLYVILTKLEMQWMCFVNGPFSQSVMTRFHSSQHRKFSKVFHIFFSFFLIHIYNDINMLNYQVTVYKRQKNVKCKYILHTSRGQHSHDAKRGHF